VVTGTKLADCYGPGRLGLSFELFPPKTAQGDAALFAHAEVLWRFRPDYMTCTYGAGGSTRSKTLEIVRQLKRRFGIPVASHLTCVGATVEDLRGYLAEASGATIDYIVALRGDPPQGQSTFQAVAGGLRYGNELVALIRSEFPGFGIAVGGYPEKHQEAPSFEVDLANLKRKVDAGADVIITQLFYRNDDYFRFVERCQQIGIHVPIVPGLLPVTNLAQIQRIASLCQATLPASFVERLAERDDQQWQFQVGVDYATAQVDDLVRRGIPGLHFYVLNKSEAASQVLQQVGLQHRSDK
jgi:methylenetetrahydrofolate reductase (NADPH)